MSKQMTAKFGKDIVNAWTLCWNAKAKDVALAVLSDTGATVLVTLNALSLLMAPRASGA
jgi:hypothetical protein